MKESIDTENVKEAYADISRALGVSNDFARLLYARGFTNAAEAEKFLYPSIKNLASPFEICGMREACARIDNAVANKERILIYGDYDCDGICAVSILKLFLDGKTDVSYFIPDRAEDGYGLSRGALEKIFTERKTRGDNTRLLIITVDCGIASADEVEYIKSQGADVIITDHHEPQNRVPDCIVVNAKLNESGFREYCGAGVALKMVEALGGREEAEKYADIAALATIADVVPLISDNRIIASIGLKMINDNPRTGIKLLAEAGQTQDNLRKGAKNIKKEKIDAYSVMFKLAPRINAAGRLSSAMKAVDLFVSDDWFILKELAAELERDNRERQRLCDEIYTQAVAELKGINFDITRVIMLENKNWEAGVLGIVAARLVEQFKCPAILFSESDGILKGSARSVSGVNIFELLKRFKDKFVSFGGHSQAAGLSLKKENYQIFKREINAYAVNNYDADIFRPHLKFDARIKNDADFFSLAKETVLMEPTGYGNPRFAFAIDGKGLEFKQIGNTNHVKCAFNGAEIVAFNDYAQTLGVNCGDKDIVFSLGINEFRNRLYAQGIVKNVLTKSVEADDAICEILNLHQLEKLPDADGDSLLNVKKIDYQKLNGLIGNPFGTIIICFNSSEYKKLCERCADIKKLPLYFSMPQCLNPQTAVIVSPSKEFKYAYFNNAVIAGNPLSAGYLDFVGKETANLFIMENVRVVSPSVSDNALRNIFVCLRSLQKSGCEFTSSDALYNAVLNESETNGFETVSPVQFFVALKILAQLALFSLSERGKIVISSNKCDLNQSFIYRNMRKHGRLAG